MILSVETTKLESAVNKYEAVEKNSKNDVESKLTGACSKYSKAPSKVISQLNKIVNALETYRTGTMKKRIKEINEKKDDFEKAVTKIKSIFDSFESNEQNGIAVKPQTASVTGTALGKFTDFVIKEEDLPKVWKATTVDTVLNDLTTEQYDSLKKALEILKDKYNIDAIQAVKISDYMVSIALPAYESTIYKMVKVYLNAPDKFEIDFNMPMYLEDGLGQAQLNTIGILADMISYEYNSSPVSISESFNEAYSALEAKLSESLEVWNAYINTKNIGTIQKVKLTETESFSSADLQSYSTSELSSILKQVQLDNLTARIELTPTSGITLTGKNDNGNIDVVLDEPKSFAVLASDDNGFEVFGWGNFYYVKLEDMEMDQTQFNLYYTA